MGFFTDLKDDLSQAVNELLPEDEKEIASETVVEEEKGFVAEVDDMVDETVEENVETAYEPIEAAETENDHMEADLDAMLDTVEKMETPVFDSGYQSMSAEEKTSVDYSSAIGGKHVTDETSVLTKSMLVNGNIATEGSMDVMGSIVGDIEVLGKLNITGTIQGNSQAAEIYAEGAKITGELRSSGSIKIGQSTVIIGNVYANGAVIAGAVKGDIDVKGPVILDASAIVMGDIKSKSVQINNGAVIEGMCSQCYAEVNPTSFFDELKKMK